MPNDPTRTHYDTCPRCHMTARQWRGDTIRIVVCPSCGYSWEETLGGCELDEIEVSRE